MKNDNSILLSEASIATSKEVRQGTLLVEDGKSPASGTEMMTAL